MYFVADDKILVNFQHYRSIVMDISGTVVDQAEFDLFRPYKVIKESTVSRHYNKFMLLKDLQRNAVSLVECFNDGSLEKKMHTCQIQEL